MLVLQRYVVRVQYTSVTVPLCVTDARWGCNLFPTPFCSTGAMAAMTAASSDVMLGEWSAVHSKVQRRLTALTSQLDESIRKLADTEQQLRTEEEVRRTAEEALQKLRSSARKTTNDFESRVSALTAQVGAQ